MNLLSLFSGIGSFEKALARAGVNFNLVNYCEIDKYASFAYSTIHNVDESLNLWDIRKINISKLPNIDIITHGSPCQDFSIAGKMKGGEEGSGTRSSLMWDTVDIIESKMPGIVIWENVKNVLSEKNRPIFNKYLMKMNSIGYVNNYKILNSKDYGIPQNRDRVFVISTLNNILIEWPEGCNKKIRLLDMLEDSVQEKYYIDNKIASHFIYEHSNNIDNKFDKNEINMIGLLNIKGNEQVRRVYGINGISPTLNTMEGGNRQPKILINNSTIRKLTPLECWRLMGFDDNDYCTAKAALMKKFYNGKDRTNSQMYKMAGNSIVVDVLENIFKGIEWGDLE